MFTSHRKVRKMNRRIKEYDTKTNAIIEPVMIEDVEKSFDYVKTQKDWPAPDFVVMGDGKIIEITDRQTGAVLRVL